MSVCEFVCYFVCLFDLNDLYSSKCKRYCPVTLGYMYCVVFIVLCIMGTFKDNCTMCVSFAFVVKTIYEDLFLIGLFFGFSLDSFRGLTSLDFISNKVMDVLEVSKKKLWMYSLRS